MAWKRSIMELSRRASASIGGVEVGVEAGEEADEDGGDEGVEAAEDDVESMVDDKEVLLWQVFSFGAGSSPPELLALTI